MEWSTDWGLRGRMAVTMGLLFAVYLVFVAVLTLYFENMLFAVVLLGGFSLAQLFFSEKLALYSMGAKRVDPEEYPDLHDAVTRLSQQADLPKPDVAVADTRTPNAFAAGRSQSSATVCVTTGLLDTLDREELDGVLAHELAHVKNRDVMVMTIATFLSSIAFLIVRWGWLFGGGGRDRRGGGGGGVIVAIGLSLVVWIISFLLIRALSRYREYAADRGGAAITGQPSALASALAKISNRMDRVPNEDLREQSEMNALFVIPIDTSIVGKLFRTHPPTEKRIDRLRDLERELETV
ncbi:zinc metalloprotease HtpX [Halococcoides cellulosivorans]|uniref:Protease HtpX homolog n=1 Tax=Halococcoides cellulosivorans TaxID=1679096 RepID=A0A2R4X0Q9_9EURY|nr:zinc metalloprotease HtpX [Halococcoides cellulosivorans]AWB27379.1 zinc metalloprotease HtpX [Halococcoides cellulosivorans]